MTSCPWKGSHFSEKGERKLFIEGNDFLFIFPLKRWDEKERNSEIV